MAVLFSCDVGWILSHEKYIESVYKNTENVTETKSYFLNPALFDIQIPFTKNKNLSRNRNKNVAEDAAVVIKAYQILRKLYKLLDNFSNNIQNSNSLAKSQANKFYCELTQHPNFKFVGGNTSDRPLVSQVQNQYYLIPEKSEFYCYDIKEIVNILRNKRFNFILLDPPWWNKYIRRKRKQNPMIGYDMLYDQQLSLIPINSLLSDDGFIAIWCTSAPSHINAVLKELFPAWNIEYLCEWYWLKITKSGQPICDFSQPLKKQPFERIIFGVKNNSVRNLPSPEKGKVIMSVPSAIHSHKPPLCEVLKPYLPEQPICLELFARYLLPSWTSYGIEVLKLQHLSLYHEQS